MRKGGEPIPWCRLVQSMVLDKVAENEWYEKNKKWAVPVGCLVAIVVIVGFFGGLFLFAFSAFKYSGVYVESLKQAHASPAVIQALGEPIEEGFFVFGSIHVNGRSGEADIAIPISGPGVLEPSMLWPPNQQVFGTSNCSRWTSRVLRTVSTCSTTINTAALHS